MAIPVAGLDPDFLDLKTRVAGEVLQKFVTCGGPVAAVSDISNHVAASKPLDDFVDESNRGRAADLGTGSPALG